MLNVPKEHYREYTNSDSFARRLYIFLNQKQSSSAQKRLIGLVIHSSREQQRYKATRRERTSKGLFIHNVCHLKNHCHHVASTEQNCETSISETRLASLDQMWSAETRMIWKASVSVHGKKKQVFWAIVIFSFFFPLFPFGRRTRARPPTMSGIAANKLALQKSRNTWTDKMPQAQRAERVHRRISTQQLDTYSPPDYKTKCRTVRTERRKISCAVFVNASAYELVDFHEKIARDLTRKRLNREVNRGIDFSG